MASFRQSLRTLFAPVTLLLLACPLTAQVSNAARKHAARERALPLVFEQNQGQLPPEIAFLGRTRQYALAVEPGELRFSLPGAKAGEESTAIRLALRGSRGAVPVGRAQAPFFTNYYFGTDRTQYRTGIPNFTRVGLPGIYPGIDEELYARGEAIEHDFVVAPGADPSAIAMQISAPGAITLNRGGELIIPAKTGNLYLKKPVAYQVGPDRVRFAVTAAFVLEGRGASQTLRFHLGAYDRSRELVIDPVIVYASYLGGTTGSRAAAIVSDAQGNVYLAGSTTSPSTDFAVTNTVTNVNTSSGATGPSNATFVARFNNSDAGAAVAWLSYFGSTGGDSLPTALALQGGAGGSLFVGGTTAATDFPMTAGGFQPTVTGSGVRGFLASLAAANGTLQSATYVDSGTATTVATTTVSSVATDGAGDVLAGGSTNGGALPVTTNALPVSSAVTTSGNAVGFLVALTPNLKNANFCSYLAGDMAAAATHVTGVAVDAAGNLYAGGYTTGDFPQAGTYGSAPMNTSNGANAAFAAQIALNATQASLGYSVWISGAGADQLNAIALDASNDLLLFGQTTSASLPQGTTYTSATAVPAVNTPTGIASTAAPVTPAAPNKPNGATTTGFVASVNPVGQPQVLTYLGGDGNDLVLAGGVDTAGQVYAAGSSSSVQAMSYANAPLLPTGQDTSVADVQHGFLVQLPGTLSAVNYIANLGGASGTDAAVGVALDSTPNAYVAGNVGATSGAYTSYTAFQPTPLDTATTASSAYVAEISNATASAQLTLAAAAMHGSPDPIGYSGAATPTVTYTWTLTSAAPNPPTHLVVQIPQQTYLQYSSLTLVGAGGETIPCSIKPAGGSCLITSFPQAAGANDTLTLTLTAVLTSQPPSSSLTVTATVYTPDSEAVPAAETSTIQAPSQLSITAAVSSPLNNTVFTTNSSAASPSTQVTYAFTVMNTGSSNVSNAALTLTLPSGASAFVPSGVAGPAGANCNLAGCTGVSIPAGGSVVYSITGTYPDAALNGMASAMANQSFTLEASVPPAAPVSFTYGATTTLQRGVHLVLGSSLSAAAAGQSAFNLGDSLTYTVTVTNNGPSTSSGSDTLVVTLPVGFVASASAGFTCNAASPAVCTQSIAALAATGTTSYTLTGTFPDTLVNAGIGATAVSEAFSATATLSGDFESGTPGSDYSTGASAAVYRTANLSVTTSTLTPPAGKCATGPTCVYMQNSSNLGDQVAYTFVVRNAGPDTSVNTVLTLTLPSAPANPTGTPHPLLSGTPTVNVSAPTFGTTLSCVLAASGNQIVCSGGNLPVGNTALTIAGNLVADAATVPPSTTDVTTAASPGSVTLAQSANGTPGATTLSPVEIDRAAHLVASKTVVPSGTKPSLPINLEESNPAQAAGVNDILTATVSVGNTPLNSAPGVILNDTLPAYFRLTAVPANVACTVNGVALTTALAPSATAQSLVCTLGTVAAGTATPSTGSTPATLGSPVVSFSYSGKFVDNGAAADITGAPASKLAQLAVTLGSAAATTPVAVDPYVPSDATSATASVNVVRSAHILLRKTRNTAVAAAPATFADTTDPNLDEMTTAARFGVNDEIEYDVALANGGVNKALGVQFTDTLPPYFTVVSAYLVTGAPLAPDSGANSMPGAQTAGLVCYAGAAATGTPLPFPYRAGAGGQQITCVAGSPTAPVAVAPGTSKAGSLDNGTAIEVVYQGKYQDNAPGADDIGAGVSTFAFTSAAGAAVGSANLSVDSAPASGDNLSAALPAYNVQRAAHLSILSAPLQTTTSETPLTMLGTGALVAEAEPGASGGTPAYNCLRYKIYVQNSGPNISRQPQVTLATPAGLDLTSSPVGPTTTPGSDTPLASSCSYGATISPVVTGSVLRPLTELANSSLVVDADAYFGLNTLTMGNSQGGFVLSYTALTDPGIMDSAKGTFSTVSGAPLTVVNTPSGSNFVVTPFTNGSTRPVSITFGAVTTPGATTEQVSSSGFALPTGKSPDPRYGTIPLYRTGAHPQFYTLGSSAIEGAGGNATTLCVTSGVAGTPLPDTFAKPERVLLWVLGNLPGGTALNPVPNVVTPYTGDITSSVSPSGAAAYVEPAYPANLPATGTVSAIPAAQSQPAQVCGQVNGFAPAASPATVAVLEPVNFSPYITANSSQTPVAGKGVSEVSFLFPNAHDYNDSDPCYIASANTGTSTRKACDDNLVLTTWVFGGESLLPSAAHVLGPYDPLQAQTQGFLNSTVGHEVQAGATLFELVADQLAAQAYVAAPCDPGIASSGYTPVTTTTPCPVSASALTGTPPQAIAFGSGEIAELVPSPNGGSSGLILLPPAQTPASLTTGVEAGYVAATATVTRGQTAGFQWNLLSIVPTTGGTYSLSCYMVDAATLSVVTPLPAGLSCQIPATITYGNPSSSNPPANPAIYVVTQGTVNASLRIPSWKTGVGGVVFAGLLLPIFANRRRRGLSAGLGLLSVLLLLGVAAGLAGCGSPATTAPIPTTPGTYYFRVNATNGGSTLTTAAFSVKVLAGD